MTALPRPPVWFWIELLLFAWLLGIGRYGWAIPLAFLIGSNFGIAMTRARIESELSKLSKAGKR